MRKQANMFLRGGTWTLRIAVPKDILDIRKEQGKRSNREVWQSLGTGDVKKAELRLAHARAQVLQAFDDEREAFRARPVPTADQLRDAGTLFRATVKASLLNERMQELAAPLELARAETELGAILSASDASSGPSLTKRLYDLEWLVSGPETMNEDRASLRARLWSELKVMDPVSVDPFIRHIAQVNGFKITADGQEYRHLARILQTVWIEALDEADEVVTDTAYHPPTQDEVLAIWDAPLHLRDRLNDMSHEVISDAATTPIQARPRRVINDIKTYYNSYLAERFPRLSAAARLERERTVAQFVEVSGLKELTEYRKADMAAFKNALVKLPTNAVRDYPGMTVGEIIASVGPEIGRLATKTVQLRLSYMSAFGKWLSDNVDGVDAANFSTSAPAIKKKAKVVKEFSDDESRRFSPARASQAASPNETRSKSELTRFGTIDFGFPRLLHSQAVASMNLVSCG